MLNSRTASLLSVILVVLARPFPTQGTEECNPFRKVLEVAVVDFAASYFSDNPRGEVLVPEQIDPLTAQNLFIAYYGNGASSVNFKTALTKILYSDPGVAHPTTRPTQEALIAADRVSLRHQIYTYAKAGSYDLTREKFGVLLYNGVAEIAGEKWEQLRCLHAKAVRKAKNIIHHELSRLRNEVGEYHIAQILGLRAGTTLAFAIDDTGSMSGEIDAAIKRATDIIDERQGSLDQPQNFVLVPFNDPTVGPLTVTHDADKFKNAIRKLYAHGGGDSPELAMRGIQLAVENSNPGSSIFVITDVEAKDIQLQDNVIAQAKQKNIKVTFLLTNRIHGEMCRRKCPNPSLKHGYELYEYIATSTGGRILVVQKRDIFKATEVIASTLKQGLVEVFREVFVAGNHTRSIPVDSALTDLYLRTVGKCEVTQLLRPDGSPASQLGKITVDALTEVQIPLNGDYGIYTLQVENPEKCDLKILARSTKGFVKSLAKNRRDEKTGKESLTHFEGQALDTDSVTVFIDEYGKQAGDLTTSIEIHDLERDSVQTFKISKQADNHFHVPIDSDHGRELMVILKGVDKAGYQFQRVSPNNIEFVSLDIDCSVFTNMIFRSGHSSSVNVTISNVSPKQETFSIEASDSKEYVKGEPPVTVTVDPGTVQVFPVTLKAGEKETTGSTTTITITAKPQQGDYLIFKQCRLVVGQKEKPDIESFAIESTIKSRFAETSVTSTVYNNATVGRMAEFNVILPRDAFITEFLMTIDNETYPGKIEEQERAKKILERAKARGLTAGHVAAREESTTVFKTSVNLEAKKRVVFVLKYQELLRKSQGKYRHEVIVQTKQPVGRLSVDIHICENRPLNTVKVVGFKTEQSVQSGPLSMPGVLIAQKSTTAHVSFKPTLEEQLQLSPLGLNGKFITEYDVVQRGGKDYREVVASDRNFVQFFSPDLDVMSKRVVFVLDTSASMYGRKMEQLRSAMASIIEGLNEEDDFAIVTFNSNTTRWPHGSSNSMAPASKDNKASAKQFMANSKTTGGTDMSKAVNESLNILGTFLDANEKNYHPTSDYLLLLTDGRPTEGIVEASELVEFIDGSNNQSFGLHTIGFGSLVDAKLLAKIAARNKGSFIQIFEDIDADLQVELTLPTLPALNRGAEFVITGTLMQNVSSEPQEGNVGALFDFTLKGKGKGGEDYSHRETIEAVESTECLKDSSQVDSFTERSAFMGLQDALKKMTAETEPTLIEEMKADLLNKSLEFGFVTPGITSMVVLKPDDEQVIDEELELERQKEVDKEKKDRAAAKETESEALRGAPRTDDDDLEWSGLVREDLEVEYPDGPSFDGAVGGGGGGVGGAFRIVGGESRSRVHGGSRAALAYGDPHFVIDLQDQLTICFDWQGDEGEVVNLLHDEENGVTVNGRLSSVKTLSKHNHKRIYINQLGIVMKHKRLQILITCEEMVLNDKQSQIHVPLSRSGVVEKHGVVVRIDRYSEQSGMIFIQIAEGIKFGVATHKENGPLKLDHLDFITIDSSGMSGKSFGVIGQFIGNNNKKHSAMLSMWGKDKAKLQYGGKSVRVSHNHYWDFTIGHKVECWGMKDVASILDQDKERYIVQGIFDKPSIATGQVRGKHHKNVHA